MKQLVTTLTLVFLIGMLGLYGCGNSSKGNSEVHLFCSGKAQANILYIDKIKGVGGGHNNVDEQIGFILGETLYEAEIKLDLHKKQVLFIEETPFNLEDLWSPKAGEVPAYAANDIGLNSLDSCYGPEAQLKFHLTETESELHIRTTCQSSPRPWVQLYILDRLSGRFDFYFGMEDDEQRIEPVANLYAGRCTSAADRRF